MFFCLHYSRTSTNLGYVLHLFIDVNTFHALRSVNNSAQANNEFYVSVCGGKIFYVYSWAYLEAVLGAKCPHVDAVQLNTANVLSISSNYTHAVCFETRSYDKILFNSIYAYILFNFWVKIGSITILTKKWQFRQRGLPLLVGYHGPDIGVGTQMTRLPFEILDAPLSFRIKTTVTVFWCEWLAVTLDYHSLWCEVCDRVQLSAGDLVLLVQRVQTAVSDLDDFQRRSRVRVNFNFAQLLKYILQTHDFNAGVIQVTVKNECL